MAEINKLKAAAIILFVVSAIVLIGMALVDGISDSVRDSTTTTRNITLANGTAVTLTDTWVTAITNLTNASNTSILIGAGNYTATTSTKGVAGSVTLTTADPWDGSSATVTYTYNAASTSSSAADTFSAGLAVFATFMAIIALALVGKEIIGLFRKKGD